MVQFLSIIFFSWISSIFVGFFKSSRLFVSLCLYMYSVKHNNVFVALVATSCGRYDHHQANATQNLKWLVT